MHDLSQELLNYLDEHIALSKTHVIICHQQKEAWDCYQDLCFYYPDLKIELFPDWETLAYDTFSPHQDIISKRLTILHDLLQKKPMLLLISVHTLMHFISPTEYLKKHAFQIANGQIIELDAFKNYLLQAQYQNMPQVEEHGQFACKASIVDVFPMGSNAPIRIEWFDNQIESLRFFDPVSQVSIQKIDKLELLPAKEFPYDDAAIRQFRQRYRELLSGSLQHSIIYEQVTEGQTIQGLEYYLCLFFDKLACFFDYLDDETQLIMFPGIQDFAERYWKETRIRYEQRRHDISRPILEPEHILISVEDLQKQIAARPHHRLMAIHESLDLPDLKIDKQNPQAFHRLKSYLQEPHKTVLIASSLGRREVIHDLCKAVGLFPKIYSDWNAIEDFEGLSLIVGPFRQALKLKKQNILCLTEYELFGETIVFQRSRRTSKSISHDKFIRDLSELKMGMAVVHSDYGIGRYQGLQNFEHQGLSNEFLVLSYANDDKIYVPINNLNLISKYSSSDDESAPLHKLGNETWQKEKKKAADKIYDMAVELLETQANRESQLGFQCDLAQTDYERFVAGFRFTETEDQANAIAAIIQDLSSTKPMDRLICGDVGFGKTEVAMRAAYIMVQNHRQVCVLVPTTLLAKQHFETFQERFADFPICVELISRFRSKKDSESVLTRLSQAKVDILIGTHKLLQQDVQFKDLGLLIIDEEHRFGVKQKEYIKRMKHQADILSLTATPIPRTLNMAMHGVRDISIISTPPAKRLAIKTFWNEKNPRLVREAILREILRGGQVYYLQNDIDKIEHTSTELRELIPEAKIECAHGQMNERHLERITADFYHQKFNVLVCTTIIETGIDIPTANTIIMERADKLGLAQMHQLRGRVGRSHHQAYAYLLTPHSDLLSNDAKKRLEAIISLEDLGSGFSLAMHDMEIRGAGAFLGEEQSGNLHAIGYSLYMELLEQAIADIKAGKIPRFDAIRQDTEIDLKISTIIPNDYIHDVNQRLLFYKRFAHAKNYDELHELQIELIDRFGLMPDSIKNLISVTRLKIQAQQLGIKRILVNQKQGLMEFQENAKIDFMKIIELVQKESHIYKLNPQQQLLFTLGEDKLGFVEHLLAMFERQG